MSARQKILGLGVSGLKLHFMTCACKGYKSTSNIKTFDSNVKQKALNAKKC